MALTEPQCLLTRERCAKHFKARCEMLRQNFWTFSRVSWKVWSNSVAFVFTAEFARVQLFRSFRFKSFIEKLVITFNRLNPRDRAKN